MQRDDVHALPLAVGFDDIEIIVEFQRAQDAVYPFHGVFPLFGEHAHDLERTDKAAALPLA